MKMKLQEFIYGRLLSDGKANPWAILKVLCFGLWAMLTKPGIFEKNGEILLNLVPNGAFRVLLGGFMMILVGFGLVLSGLAASLAIIFAFAVSPFAALYIAAAARVHSMRYLKHLDAKVKAAVKATKAPKNGD